MNRSIICQKCGCLLTIEDALTYKNHPICPFCADEEKLDTYAMNTMSDKALLDMLGFVPKRSKPSDV